MGFLGSLAKLGLAAGAVFGAVKITEKYKADNPAGVEGVQGKVDAVKQAASEVYEDFKEKAPVATSAAEAAAQKASAFISEKAPVVAEKAQELKGIVNEKAPGLVETAENAAQKANDLINEKGPAVADAVSKVATTVAEKAQEFSAAHGTPEDHFSSVVDETAEAPIEESSESKNQVKE